MLNVLRLFDFRLLTLGFIFGWGGGGGGGGRRGGLVLDILPIGYQRLAFVVLLVDFLCLAFFFWLVFCA